MGAITSRHNPLFKALLNMRKDRGVMLMEGRRLVEDALSRGCVPRSIAATAAFIDGCHLAVKPQAVLSESLLADLTDTETPQGILGFFEVPWARVDDIVKEDRVVILDGLQDPGNVGTIVRTAEAFGFTAMLIMPTTASPFSAKAVRASMGSCLGIRIARGGVGEAKRLPHRILALAPGDGTALCPSLFKGKTAVCLGQEAAGVSREVLAIAHETVRIPMTGRTESLNVAVAAGIVMACAAGVFDPPSC
ncbi:MAG TPA: RNA methyltransferase [Deltaproteobacteria bacterium]|jgi:TrmH family RNA methyltransferase|nr:RNA methyltransferase [Deltaproteobacteria bacterium]OQC21788.1 MAG: 23S rRNA (uridine(2479)-2'-O)-methyltransferase [Deltaproteobacteria bacterium ADurb.Bin072]NMD40535.1 RNA methyltransferase [Deltaproteobacteria bacterium]HOC76193.1 RNA methyltransferase [Deltaproteobacteria bacterium]HON96259.1 RNA methyltransferase [Deltaproteobacteria bacterium]